MPYSGAGDPKLPPKIRKLSPKKRRQFVSVFNSVLKKQGDEGRAFASAYSAVKEAAEVETILAYSYKNLDKRL